MARYPASPEKVAARDSIAGWQDRTLIPIRPASTVLGISTAAVYALVYGGQLVAVKLAGRTLIKTDSLRRLVETAQPFESSGPRGLARTRAAEIAQRAA